MYHIKHRNQFASLINENRYEVCAEIGLGRGLYAIHLLENSNFKILYSFENWRSRWSRKVKERTRKEGFHNIETILSDEDTGLPNENIDVILLYGVLPEVEDRKSLLKEVHRVLKPGGCLSTRYCFRMKKGRVVGIIEGTNLFSLAEERGHMLNFGKKN